MGATMIMIPWYQCRYNKHWLISLATIAHWKNVAFQSRCFTQPAFDWYQQAWQVPPVLGQLTLRTWPFPLRNHPLLHCFRQIPGVSIPTSLGSQKLWTRDRLFSCWWLCISIILYIFTMHIIYKTIKHIKILNRAPPACANLQCFAILFLKCSYFLSKTGNDPSTLCWPLPICCNVMENAKINTSKKNTKQKKTRAPHHCKNM